MILVRTYQYCVALNSAQVGVNKSVNSTELVLSGVPHDSHTYPGHVYDGGLMGLGQNLTSTLRLFTPTTALAFARPGVNISWCYTSRRKVSCHPRSQMTARCSLGTI